MNRVRSNRGMTLLEVMVALAIFALTGSAILKAAGDHLTSVGQIEEMTFASWVASNRLSEMQREGTWPPRNKRGTMEMADRTWYWQQQVVKTNDDDMRSVTISVGLDADYQSSLTSVSTFIAKPTP
ncbi:type II secretion system minor pseudopilin GspI [Alteromonas sp. CYL-A6]|uniref:type II secretion system minor pseudopilin GspI n=1 Tax=Alteromonas nitratireducens TaxID=3390813 RepID=UPI0034BDD14C